MTAHIDLGFLREHELDRYGRAIVRSGVHGR